MTPATEPARRVAHPQRFAWLGFVVVAVTYAFVAAWHIDLPGVYMDEVNPDYLAVKILNPHHAPIVAWVLQGNYLLGDRVPIMVQLYHGSQTFWLGLPLFWLFGTTVERLRLAHAVLAAAILAALYAVLLRARLRPWQAAATCIALAIDPFVFVCLPHAELHHPRARCVVAARRVLPAARRRARRVAAAPLLQSPPGRPFGARVFHPRILRPCRLRLLPRGSRAATPPLRASTRPPRVLACFSVGVSPYLLAYDLILRKVTALRTVDVPALETDLAPRVPFIARPVRTPRIRLQDARRVVSTRGTTR